MEQAITIQNNAHLEKLLRTDPTMEQYMQTAVRYVLEQARRDVVSEAANALENDPRHAARAVRHTLYKRVLGGNINILRKKRAGQAASVPPSTRGRSADTERMMGYQGSDRGFILRFVNKGTDEREVSTINNRRIRSGQKASRGFITGKNFFGTAAKRAIEEAIPLLQAEFEKIVKQQMQ